jgi:hypothetical protein
LAVFTRAGFRPLRLADRYLAAALPPGVDVGFWKRKTERTVSQLLGERSFAGAVGSHDNHRTPQLSGHQRFFGDVDSTGRVRPSGSSSISTAAFR